MAFTAKQQAFIEGKAAGLGTVAAFIGAGYARSGAKQSAHALLKKPGVQAAITKARKSFGVKPSKSLAVESDGDDAPLMKAKYPGSLAFMQDAMNNPRMPVSVRFEAAKQLLPYENSRMGEKGKKETAKDVANAIAGKFGTKAPPKLPAGVVNIASARK